MSPYAYRYSTVWGYAVQRDGGEYLVFDPQGNVIARAASWRKAIFWAADQRPANAPTAANAPVRAGSAPKAPDLEPDGLPPVDDAAATASLLAELGRKDDGR